MRYTTSLNCQTLKRSPFFDTLCRAKSGTAHSPIRWWSICSHFHLSWIRRSQKSLDSLKRYYVLPDWVRYFPFSYVSPSAYLPDPKRLNLVNSRLVTFTKRINSQTWNVRIVPKIIWLKNRRSFGTLNLNFRLWR